MLKSAVWRPIFAQIDLKNCIFRIKDGTVPANTLDVTIGEGNMTWSEKKNRKYTLNRGILDEVRNDDESPMDVKFEFTWEYIRGTPTSDGLPSVQDALKQLGGAAAWVSSDSDACRPYAVDLEIIYQPTPVSCGDQESILFPDFRYETLDHDLKAGSVSCSGKCNAKEPTVTRQTNS
jgi:hypothetical protein